MRPTRGRRTRGRGRWTRAEYGSWVPLLLFEGDDTPGAAFVREADGRGERSDAGGLRIDVVDVGRRRGRRGVLRDELQGHAGLVGRRIGRHALDGGQLALKPRPRGAAGELGGLGETGMRVVEVRELVGDLARPGRPPT